MFGDATLMSKAGVRELVYQTEIYDKDAMLQVATRDIANRSPHSFIAVGYTTPKQVEHVQRCVQKASQRARCIAGTLAVSLPVITPGEPSTCALLEDVHWQLTSYSTIVPHTSQWSFSGHTRLPLFSTVGMLQRSRKELQRLLFQDSLSGLTKVLLLKDESPFAVIFEKAVLQLYEALLALDHSQALLAAVTTLELLLTSADYKIIEQEVKSLIGAVDATYLQIGNILKARSQYVHEARKVIDSEEHLRAVALGLMSLIRFSDLARNFGSKNEVLGYLKRISEVDAFLATLGAAEQSAVQTVLQRETIHRRQGYYLDWMPVPSLVET